MIDFLQVYLPICIYVLLIILLIICIVLGVRVINAMDKVDALLDNIKNKVNTLNGFFNVIDFTTDKISQFSDKLTDLASGLIKRIMGRRNRKDEEEDYE